ncbi:uncharacterized protein CLUP02_01228 [Colletotrichum lupini]|uniref:Uncharacterized protein n=1 Tax=Colletotrichum lupini TaxID=145971 RepID=A0A9Q8SBX5_9PEZI|nr:uncharacterized protein CLUP02_01228 [Colletotrichum lupini]UQC74577.1 hypothetical protein CLUP02_01228 [Colletotrichum lupini]
MVDRAHQKYQMNSTRTFAEVLTIQTAWVLNLGAEMSKQLAAQCRTTMGLRSRYTGTHRPRLNISSELIHTQVARISRAYMSLSADKQMPQATVGISEKHKPLTSPRQARAPRSRVHSKLPQMLLLGWGRSWLRGLRCWPSPGPNLETADCRYRNTFASMPAPAIAAATLLLPTRSLLSLWTTNTCCSPIPFQFRLPKYLALPAHPAEPNPDAQNTSDIPPLNERVFPPFAN